MPTASLLAIFGFAFVIGFGAVVSPGPISTSIVSHSPRNGWTTGPLVSAGHAFMELLIVLLIGLGLSTLLNHPTIQLAIALLGGLLLLWMGITMLIDVWRKKIHVPGTGSTSSRIGQVRIFLLGILATFSSPFWYAGG
jgi:threonine/homoserine/homoserine lactone efflux protein